MKSLRKAFKEYLKWSRKLLNLSNMEKYQEYEKRREEAKLELFSLLELERYCKKVEGSFCVGEYTAISIPPNSAILFSAYDASHTLEVIGLVKDKSLWVTNSFGFSQLYQSEKCIHKVIIKSEDCPCWVININERYPRKVWVSLKEIG